MPNENAITQKLIKALNGVPGCRARKRHGGKFQSGEADVSVVYKGRAIFIEVKLENGALTRLQGVELSKWKDAGARAFVAWWYANDKYMQVIEWDDAHGNSNTNIKLNPAACEEWLNGLF